MNLRDIKLRIRSVRKTRQITRAMKMVAAVKFRHAQACLINARPYAARIRELAARALEQRDPAGDPPPLLQRRGDRRPRPWRSLRPWLRRRPWRRKKPAARHRPASRPWTMWSGPATP